MKTFAFILLCFYSLTTLAGGSLPTFQEGDIIFHQSTSPQSAALREVTKSEWTHVGIVVKGDDRKWYVAEAIATVRATPLQDFIRRGRDELIVVKRIRPELINMNRDGIKKLKDALKTFQGKSYDVLFRWEDNLIYCSELVWKAYQIAFGFELTVPEKFRDLEMDGPEATRLRRERYEANRIPFNLDEVVVTPVSVMQSTHLIDVTR